MSKEKKLKFNAAWELDPAPEDSKHVSIKKQYDLNYDIKFILTGSNSSLLYSNLSKFTWRFCLCWFRYL